MVLDGIQDIIRGQHEVDDVLGLKSDAFGGLEFLGDIYEHSFKGASKLVIR